MKYLDEQIEVAVSGFTITENKSYIYRVFKDNSEIFVGNTYLSTDMTSKVFNISDIVRNYAYINQYFDGKNKNIMFSTRVVLNIGTSAYNSNTETIYSTYRYPHYLNRLERTRNCLQGGLIPVYPGKLTNNYNIVSAINHENFESRSTVYMLYKNGDQSGKSYKYTVPIIGINDILPTIVSTTSMTELFGYPTPGQYKNIEGVWLDEDGAPRIYKLDDTAFESIGNGLIVTIGYWYLENGQSRYKKLYDLDMVTAPVEFSYEIKEVITPQFFTLNIGDQELGIRPPVNTSYTEAPYKISFETQMGTPADQSFTIIDIKVEYYEGGVQNEGIFIQEVSRYGFIQSTYKIGEFCNNLDGYYLQWQDRLGGIQSQHFEGYPKFFNEYEITDITNYRGEKRLVSNNVTSRWEINSGWINEIYYPNYESIYTSPYLILYDVKEDTTYNVVLKDTNYEEKTFHNQGRQLFNLKLNLELDTKQNIIY